MTHKHTHSYTAADFRTVLKITAVLGVLYLVSVWAEEVQRDDLLQAHHQEPVQCLQLGEDESGFPESPCLVLLCKLLWTSVEAGESSPLCFVLHSAAVTVSAVGLGRWCFTAAQAPGVQHAQVRLGALPVPCSAVTAVWGLGLQDFPGCCTFGKSGEQGLHWKNFCFVQCVCHNQELNWTVPTWGRSEGDHSFWSLVQNYSTGLGWHSVHSMFWLVAPFMDVCCNLILDRFSPLNL